MPTDLVQAALVREDGNVSVVACASCAWIELSAEAGQSLGGELAARNNAPDMMATGVYV